ncbi:ABC transporter substrate-binding protein [Enterococcus sp. LJL90]
MKLWKLGLTAASIVAAAAIMTACGNSGDSGSSSSDSSGGDGQTTLKITTWDYETTPEFKALFEAFEAENPDITIEPVDIASSDYDTKLTTMLSSGDTTDILTMKNLLSYGNYAYRDQLMDLTDHISSLDIEPAQESYDMYEVNGKTYAQPYRTDFWVLYYNKTLFDEAGIDYPENITWDEYQDLAAQLTNSDAGVYGAYQHTWRSTIQAIAQVQNDGDLMDPSDYSYMAPYYDRALAMQEAGSQMDYGTAKTTKVTYSSQFEESKAAMMYMGTWYTAGLLSRVASGETDVQWGIAQMPQLEKGDDTTTFGSPTAFAINKNADHADAAQKFIDFATGEEGAKVLAGIGVVPSYRTDAINDIYFGLDGMPTDDEAQKAYNPGTIGIEFPVAEDGAAVDKILTEEHELIMVGDESVEDGIGNMESRVSNELE